MPRSPVPTLLSRYPFLVSIAAGFAIATATTTAQCPWNWAPGHGLPGVDGVVQSLTTWDPDGNGPLAPQAVLGGQFGLGGTAVANNIVLFDPPSGTWGALGQGTNGPVWALVGTAAGLVAGGHFAFAGSVACNNVARWNGASWQPLGTGLDGNVATLATTANGDLYAGFFPSSVAGPMQGIARWNGTSWVSVGGGVTRNGSSGSVTKLVLLPNGDLLVLGDFDAAGGMAAPNIAVWNGSAWAAFGTLPVPVAWAALLLPNGDVAIGGDRTTPFGPGPFVWRWNGTAWQDLFMPISSGSFDSVRSLGLDGNGDLVAGTWQGCQRWNGSAWSAAPDTGGVWALHTVPGIGLVGGDRRVTTSGLLPLAPRGLDGNVRTIAPLANGEHVLGGNFTIAGGATAHHVVRSDGATFTPLGAGLTSEVHVLCERANGRIVAGHAHPNHLSEWNGTTWNVLGGGTNGVVRALLERANGDLVVGGSFSTVGPGFGSFAPRVAIRTATTWVHMGTNLLGDVAALADHNGDIVAAGDIANVGHVARWNGTAWVALGGGTNGPVTALVVLPDGRLLAGGSFTAAGGMPTSNTAIFDGTAWQPCAGIQGSVRGLALLPNGTAVAAGSFVLTLGPGVDLARLIGSNWMPWFTNTPGNLLFGPPDTIAALANGEVLVGGRFPGSTNGSAFVARTTPACPSGVAVSGSGCVGPAGLVEHRADNLPWVGTTFRATATGMPPSSLAIVVRGVPAASVPLPSLLPVASAGCDLLVVPEWLDVAVASSGEVHTAFTIPPSFFAWPPFQLREQVVPLTFGPGGITSAASSNAIVLTIGSL